MWKGLPLTFCDLTKCESEIDFLGCVMIRYVCMAANCKTNGEDMFYVKIILAIACKCTIVLCFSSFYFFNHYHDDVGVGDREKRKINSVTNR